MRGSPEAYECTQQWTRNSVLNKVESENDTQGCSLTSKHALVYMPIDMGARTHTHTFSAPLEIIMWVWQSTFRDHLIKGKEMQGSWIWRKVSEEGGYGNWWEKRPRDVREAKSIHTGKKWDGVGTGKHRGESLRPPWELLWGNQRLWSSPEWDKHPEFLGAEGKLKGSHSLVVPGRIT